MRHTLSPAVAILLGGLVAALLCVAFLAMLPGDPAVMRGPRAGTTGPAGAPLGRFMPGALLVAVIAAGAMLGASLRSGGRVGPAMRVSVRRCADRTTAGTE